MSLWNASAILSYEENGPVDIHLPVIFTVEDLPITVCIHPKLSGFRKEAALRAIDIWNDSFKTFSLKYGDGHIVTDIIRMMSNGVRSYSPVRLSIPDPPLFSASECYFASGKHIQINERYLEDESVISGYHQLVRTGNFTKMAHTKFPYGWFLFFRLQDNKVLVSIRKNMSFSEVLLVNVVVHELGHALAIPHDKDAYNIMHWDMYKCPDHLCLPSEENIRVFLKRQLFAP